MPVTATPAPAGARLSRCMWTCTFGCALFPPRCGRGFCTAVTLLLCVVALDFPALCPGYDMHELLALYKEPVFISYAVAMSVICCMGYALSKYIEHVYANQGAWSNGYARLQLVRHGVMVLFLRAHQRAA